MRAGLQALLSQIVDYAGLFPPAQLALDTAIRNYARYTREPENWMLGRFICPSAKLPELAGYVQELFTASTPLCVSVLGRGGDSAAAFGTGLADDLSQCSAFEAGAAGAALVEAVETRIPVDLVREDCTAGLVKLLAAARDSFSAAGFAHVPLAVEAPGGDRRELNERLANAISFHNAKLAMEKRGGPADRVILKLRCGGVTADAFPAVGEVAYVLAMACSVEMGIPLKFTAGLRHPIRRFDAGVNSHMHGFINVFVAALLAALYEWDAPQIAAVLEDESDGSFEFIDEGVRWKDFSASVEQIARLRQHQAISFGSCSFDEPRDDLRALGWL